MATKQNKNIKVRDLKPRKDAKGGVGTNVGNNVGTNVGTNAPGKTLNAPSLG